jgi:hypothetical protein
MINTNDCECASGTKTTFIKKYYKIAEGIYKSIIQTPDSVCVLTYCIDEYNPYNVHLHYTEMNLDDGSFMICAHESSSIEKITKEEWDSIAVHIPKLEKFI